MGNAESVPQQQQQRRINVKQTHVRQPQVRQPVQQRMQQQQYRPPIQKVRYPVQQQCIRKIQHLNMRLIKIFNNN